MTDFIFTSPEGKTYTVTGPEGSTKEEAFQRLQRKLQGMPDMPEQQPAAQDKPMPWSKVGAQALVNAPGSALRMGQDIAHSVMHPVETGQAMGGLALGGAEKTYESPIARKALGAVNPFQSAYNIGRDMGLFGDTGHGQQVEQAGEFYKQRYGGVENIKRTLAKDPVGALADVSTLFSGGETLPGRLGTMAARGAELTDPVRMGIKGAQGVGTLARKAAQPFREGQEFALSERDLRRAMEADGLSEADLTKRAAEFERDRPGVKATLADIGGEAIRGLLEKTMQSPGAGMSEVVPKLVAEQKAQVERLAEDLRGTTGTTKTAVQAIDDSVEAQRAAAQPAYKAAYEQGDRPIWNDELARIASSSDVVDAMKAAAHNWETHAIADKYGAMNPRAEVRNGMVHYQRGGIPPYPNLQFWDYTKRALDKAISDQIDKNTGRISDLGAAMLTIKNDLLTSLDKEVPLYKQARAQYAGHASYQRAIEEGKNVLGSKLSAEEVRNRMRDMSEADREAYRTGAVHAMILKMKGDPAKLSDYTKHLRSPEMREKIAAIMPTPQLAEQWARRFEREEIISQKIGGALKGSPTARRLFQAMDASTSGDLMLDLFQTGGKPSKLASLGLQTFWPQIKDFYRRGADTQLARILTTPGGLQNFDQAFRSQKLSPAAREPFFGPGAERATRAAGMGAFQAGRLDKLQGDAKDRLKDKTKPLTTEQRQTLRAVARGTATLDQRQKADTFLQRYGGVSP